MLRNGVAKTIPANLTGDDFTGIGADHRSNFVVFPPEIVSAIITVTISPIKHGSAVTVLSSENAVRVFEPFSTPCALPDGQVKTMAGGGSFTGGLALHCDVARNVRCSRDGLKATQNSFQEF